MFKVYQVPKAKFFQKNKKHLTYDGAFKAMAIKAWVKKQLIEKPTYSQNMQNLTQFL